MTCLYCIVLCENIKVCTLVLSPDYLLLLGFCCILSPFLNDMMGVKVVGVAAGEEAKFCHGIVSWGLVDVLLNYGINEYEDGLQPSKYMNEM